MKNTDNQHIKNYINFYLDNHPEFAVMLNGAWGSGKTFFIKDLISNLSKATIIKGTFVHLKPIYISLNGITSSKEIINKIREQLYPILYSKGAKVAKQALNIISKGALSLELDNQTNLDINYDITSLLKGNNDKIKGNKLIIFDDLERCKMPIEESLGYINDLVENNNCHVIILADEEKITQNEVHPIYPNIKEKTIGQSFLISTSFIEALEFFISLVNNDCQSILLKNKELITKIFNLSGHKNLRLLKRGLLLYNDLYSKIEFNKVETNTIQYIQEYLLIHFLTYYLEINFGQKDKRYFKIGFYFTLNNNNDFTEVKNIEDKYTELFIFDHLPVNHEKIKEFIYNFIINYSYSELVETIEYELNIKEENIPLISKFNNWRTLDNKTFLNDLKKLEIAFFETKILNQEVARYLGFLLDFNQKGLLTNKSKENILDRYIYLINEIDLTPYYKDFNYFKRSYIDYINRYTINDDALYFKKIKEIEEIFYYKRIISQSDQINLLESSLRNKNLRDFKKTFFSLSISESGYVFNSPIFHKISGSKFFELLIKLNNKDLIQLTYFIKNAYILLNSTDEEKKGDDNQIIIMISLLYRHKKSLNNNIDLVTISNLEFLIDVLFEKIKTTN